MALPSDYTRLNYIQSSGSQYINTGITPTANTRVVMDFQLTTADTGNRALFAVAGQFSFRWYGSSSVFRSNGSDSKDFSNTISGTDRHTVDKTATTCTLDGTYSVTNSAGSVSNPLYLLAQNTGSGVSNYASAKLYSCKIYENGSLVRDFVPCTNASGTVGLYDMANGAFYSNAGSGTFTSGGVYDPTAPVGNHNTLIDGTARAIAGGTVMVGGTVYTIVAGKTLVDGSARTIVIAPSAPSIITVNITGTGHTNFVCATINGTKYSSATTLEIDPGTSISLMASSGTAGNRPNCYITLNGTRVASGSSGSGASYTFTPDCSEVNIELVFFGTNSSTRIAVTTS